MARGVGRDTSKAFCPVPCSQEGKGRVSLILTLALHARQCAGPWDSYVGDALL